MNVVVQLKDGQLDIWTGTQIPLFMIKNAASITGLRAENIQLHAQMSGGSFGRRLEDDYVRQAIELAKAFQGRPVKMTWTREEDMTHDFPRPLGIARMRGAVKYGKVDAYDLSIAYPSVTASQFGRQNLPIPGPDVAIVAGAWDQPFKIPNYRVTGYRVPELVPVSSWRSVGASGNGFLHDCFLDELIHAAGRGPVGSAGTSPRARFSRPSARCRVGEAISARTAGVASRSRCRLACPLPRWSRSRIRCAASESTKFLSPSTSAESWTPRISTIRFKVGSSGGSATR